MHGMSSRVGAVWIAAVVACTLLAQSSAPGIETTAIRFTRLDQSVIQQRLERVPRKLSDRRTALESLFRDVGCAGEQFTEERVPGSPAPDMICRLPGETGNEILVGGHYDSIEAGMGAIDDWSGSSLLPSLYQSLKSEPRHHRFVFVGFAGEERGLLGSRQLVSTMSMADRRRIQAMINLECLGLGNPEVWASRADPFLLESYSMVASSLHLEARGLNVDGVGDDDSHPFLSAGIPVLTIHSLSRDSLRMLHKKTDNLTAIHPDDYYTAYRVIATYLAYLDSKLP